LFKSDILFETTAMLGLSRKTYYLDFVTAFYLMMHMHKSDSLS